MHTMNLFEKTVATNMQIDAFKRMMKNHGFSVDTRKNRNVATETYKLASVGVTKERSKDNVGTLISVWNTNKATDKAYNVRISNDMHNKISAMSDALMIHMSNATYKDSDELCIKFYSILDVIRFFHTMFTYIDVAKQTKSATKESETKTA